MRPLTRQRVLPSRSSSTSDGSVVTVFARRETDNKSKRAQNRSKRDTSIQARVAYAEHCARGGALSKANEAVTSDLIPNSDPLNIYLLRAKHLEPAHPDRDHVRVSSILWPLPHKRQDFQSSDAGSEFIYR